MRRDINRAGAQPSPHKSRGPVVHQGSILSPLLCADVVDAVTEKVRDSLINEILYADDLVLVGETMKDLRDKFSRWKEMKERE